MKEGQNDIYYIKFRCTPTDLYESKKKHNYIKLYIKGVDDLEELSLNTSCETLQQHMVEHNM
eukprot:12575229-Heterocapsa_arctica.AAC.1